MPSPSLAIGRSRFTALSRSPGKNLTVVGDILGDELLEVRRGALDELDKSRHTAEAHPE